jgi:thiamine-phosphate pyrophosphorylase
MNTNREPSRWKREHPVARARLHAIVDVGVAARVGWKPAELARAFLDGGARLLQLRAKKLPSGAFLDLSDALVALADEYEAGIIVNDRLDVARLSGAAGVHVGQDDLPAAVAREQLGPAAIVGHSTHTVAQVQSALAEPVSYIAVGPVFGTATKDTGYNAVGLDFVSAATRLAGEFPIVAIGGVRLENARTAIDAGAASVAVISDLLVGDPVERVKAFLRILD